MDTPLHSAPTPNASLTFSPPARTRHETSLGSTLSSNMAVDVEATARFSMGRDNHASASSSEAATFQQLDALIGLLACEPGHKPLACRFSAELEAFKEAHGHCHTAATPEKQVGNPDPPPQPSLGCRSIFDPGWRPPPPVPTKPPKRAARRFLTLEEEVAAVLSSPSHEELGCTAHTAA